LATGLEALDEVLPDGGLARGAVVELAVEGGAALATSIALAACRSAQREGLARGTEAPWCAFVDPSGTLYAPGVVRAGVLLERLLMVRPPLDVLGRTVLRLVDARVFAVVVIDTVGMPGASLAVSLGVWPRLVRRMAMALEGSSSCALLITDSCARRPLALPVAQRIELSRLQQDKLMVRIAKDRFGRVSSARSVAWVRSDQAPSGVKKSGPASGSQGGSPNVRLLA
jgi:recombination protein RecA